jgi:hypothetical protein
LENEAADAAIRRIREAAYPLIFKLFGSEMPHGKQRKVVLTRLGQDLSRIETALGHGEQPAPSEVREPPSGGVRVHRERKRAPTNSRRK